MTKFIRIFLFLLLGASLLIIMYSLGSKHYNQYDDIKNKVKMFKSDDSLIDSIVLGSSHAFCISPDALGYENGVLMNHGGADPFEVHFQAKCLSELVDLEAVFISISYFTFFIDNSSYTDDTGNNSRRENRIMLYAGYPSWRLISENDYSNFILGKGYPLFSFDHWRSVFTGKTKFPNKSNDDWDEAVIEKNRQRKKFLLDRHARSRVKKFHGIIKKMSLLNKDVHEDAYDIVLQTAEDLENKNVRVIFFTPPFWKTYNELFEEKYKLATRKAMKAISHSTGAEYYDFSEHPYFQKHPELFLNSDHLNKDGYSIFNSMLKEAIQ